MREKVVVYFLIAIVLLDDLDQKFFFSDFFFGFPCVRIPAFKNQPTSHLPVCILIPLLGWNFTLGRIFKLIGPMIGDVHFSNYILDSLIIYCFVTVFISLQQHHLCKAMNIICVFVLPCRPSIDVASKFICRCIFFLSVVCWCCI